MRFGYKMTEIASNLFTFNQNDELLDELPMWNIC